MIDTHAHIYSQEFDDDRDDVVRRAREAGLQKIVLANVDGSTIDDLLKTWKRYSDICVPTVGLHPTSVTPEYLHELASLEKKFTEYPFCAIGEVGLDLYWDKQYRSEQMDLFARQLSWAAEVDLPVIVHVRDAFTELHEVMSKCKKSNLRGVIHSFSGDADDVRKLKDYGDFLFGINGIVTFKKSALPDLIPTIGLDNLLVETDCPYLAPVPYRGKRNEPSYVVKVAEKIADVLKVDLSEVDRVTTNNAKRLFNLA